VGIERDHAVIDYGCGSLRVGQHLIAYLAPGRYHGMDVTDHFYKVGLARLSPIALAEKRPKFTVISQRDVPGMQADWPEWVIATAVLQHVPPADLKAFGGKLRQLCGPATKIILTYHRAPSPLRTAAMSWAYDDSTLADAFTLDNSMTLTIREFGRPRHAGAEEWTLAIAVLAPAVAKGGLEVG
jgi:hypothetical protein